MSEGLNSNRAARRVNPNRWARVLSVLAGLATLPGGPLHAQPADLPPDNPLTWAPADTNLAIQGRQLDGWLRCRWLPALIGVVDSCARQQVVAPPAWGPDLVPTGPVPAMPTTPANALQVLLAGRVTLLADISPAGTDALAVVELPAAEGVAGGLDPRLAAIQQALGWKTRSETPDERVLDWPDLGAQLYLRGRTVLLAQSDSRLLDRVRRLAGWLPAAGDPEPRLTSLPAFTALYRPAKDGELSGYYQPDQEPPAATQQAGNGLFVKVQSAAGHARAESDRLVLDLDLNLTPPAVRALVSRPLLLGTLGPGRVIPQPASAPTSTQPAQHLAATTRPWKDVSGTLAVWHGPVYFPRHVPEWLEMLPKVGPVIIALESLAPGFSVQRDLLDGLGEQVVLLWGRSSAERDQQAGGLPYPCLAVGVPLAESDNLQRLLDNLPKVANPLLAALGVRPPAQIGRLDLQPTVFTLPMGWLLAPQVRNLPPGIQNLAAQAELVWGLRAGWLVVGTDLDYVRRCLLAQSLPATPGQAVLEHPTPDALNIRIRVHDAAEPIAAWLDYLARIRPEAFTEEWWRAQLEGGAVPRPPRIGALVNRVREPPSVPGVTGGMLEVEAIFPGTPADGLLRTGDLIWSVDDQPLDARRPRSDLARRLFAPAATGPVTLKLGVVRQGALMTIPLNLPALPDIGPNPLNQVRVWAQAFGRIEQFNLAQHLRDTQLRVQAEIQWRRD